MVRLRTFRPRPSNVDRRGQKLPLCQESTKHDSSLAWPLHGRRQSLMICMMSIQQYSTVVTVNGLAAVFQIADGRAARW